MNLTRLAECRDLLAACRSPAAAYVRRTVCLLLGLALVVPSAVVADDGDCGTVMTPEQVKRERERELEIPWLGLRAAVTFPWYIPLKIHIVRYSAGTGGLDAADLETSLENVNDQLAQASIVAFQYGGIDYIDSDDWAEILKFCVGGDNDGDECSSGSDCPDGSCERESECAGGSSAGSPCTEDSDCPSSECVSETGLLKTVNSVSGAINLYFVPVVTGSCGVSAWSTSEYQGVVINNSCATNISTTAHEITHYFDIYHTHETAAGVECPVRGDGSNCDDTGDRLCDTPADPDLSDHVSDDPDCEWDSLTCDAGADQGSPCSLACDGGANDGDPCSDDDDCPDGVCTSDDCSGGSCTTAATGPADCDSTPYSPDTDNLMSYSEKACRDKITDDQTSRLYSVWMGDRLELFNRTHYVSSTPPVPDQETGSSLFPYDKVEEGVDAAGSWHYVFIDSGSYPETMTITTPMHIRRWDEGSGSVIIGD